MAETHAEALLWPLSECNFKIPVQNKKESCLALFPDPSQLSWNESHIMMYYFFCIAQLYRHSNTKKKRESEREQRTCTLYTTSCKLVRRNIGRHAHQRHSNCTLSHARASFYKEYTLNAVCVCPCGGLKQARHVCGRLHGEVVDIFM